MDIHFKDLTNAWTQLGENDTYWSVLTRNEFKKNNITDKTIEEFFKTGDSDFAYLEKLINSYHFTFSNKVVLEFGCGVGRLLKPCSKIASKVIGIDISNPHLEIAKQVVPSGDFYLLTDFTLLPIHDIQPDIIFSIIVLQHNRPPLMKHCIKKLLEILKPNGLAVLHIPYFIPNYSFNPDRYKGFIGMEMHCVPKEEIIELITELGCTLLGTDDLDRCGGNILNTTYIVQKDNI